MWLIDGAQNKQANIPPSPHSAFIGTFAPISPSDRYLEHGKDVVKA